MEIYVVKQGDTVNAIAGRYGVTTDSVIYNNQLIYPYRLAIGQALLLSGGESPQSGGPLVTNGYAYTFISPWVLGETLPYLTEMSVFSYGFTPEGDLIFPPLGDEWMIEAALGEKTAPILTLTPFGEDGRFNNRLISALVNNPFAVENLIFQLLVVMSEKGFQGVDIDFEYIVAEDRDAFTTFVRIVTEAMNAEGYTSSVAVAPKTSADQPGLLYEGKDYGGLGAAANSVLLMTYEWGYAYGPPMAVAPLNMVRRVVDYAVTEIPREKINLGVPNYGYDWTLPFVRDVGRARTIGNVEAVQLAIQYGVEIQFDDIAQSPFFFYEAEGKTHEVWFEDPRSIRAKINLVLEYELRGVGVWQIMQLFRGMWLLLAENQIY